MYSKLCIALWICANVCGFFIWANAQNCLPNGVSFFEQSEVDLFSVHYPGCTSIGGNVLIKNTQIAHLGGLEALREIKGNLIIENNAKLKSLSGLKSLVSVSGAIEIKNNDSLLLPIEFGKLEHAGAIIIHHNDQLPGVAAMPSLKGVGGDFSLQDNSSLTQAGSYPNLLRIWGSFRLVNNANLQQAPYFPALKAVNRNFLLQRSAQLQQIHLSFIALDSVRGTIEISRNSKLENIIDFPTLRYAGGIHVLNNPALYSIKAYDSLTSVDGNVEFSNLTALTALPNFLSLKKIVQGDLIIDNNDRVKSTKGSFSALESIGGKLSITNNNGIPDAGGFEQLHTIQGGLIINYNTGLTSLKGFENLRKIGNSVDIAYNDSLENLEGLNNLFNLEGGFMAILNNGNLTSLKGLETLSPNSISSITVQDCKKLSHCHTKSVCSLLQHHPDKLTIESNAAGCNSKAEVYNACFVGTEPYSENLPQFDYFAPNNKLRVTNTKMGSKIEIMDINGVTVMSFTLNSPEYDVALDELPSGYFIIKIGDNVSRFIKI